MNITPHISPLPIATVVNPPTESLRRDNNVREVVAQPAAVAQSAAEKGVASEKDKNKTPAQNNEHIDFANLRKQAEENSTSIGNSTEKHSDSSSDSQQQASNSEENKEEQNQAQANEAGAIRGDGSIAGENESVNEASNKEKSKQRLEERQIQSLKQRDREVRAHEQAHASVGGSSTGAPSYTFQVGPDGKKYAVGGEVSVNTSSVSGDPRATITKMQKVYSAALAPANPSSQDYRVAASASRAILQAQTEILATDPLEEPVEHARAITNAKFSQQVESESESTDVIANDFDALINQTLKAQEEISPERTEEVAQRAMRIEKFYQKINQAYEKAPNFQFQLTA
ncbi:MAG: hypothetical protein HRT38_03025 [Alteromonadaceae bacterium]|nr:hypothetical protein [Alteromonadaceae bacterium]